MTFRVRGWFLLGACVLASPGLLFADDPVDYVTAVKPILSHRCYACHGALKQKNNLRLDTAALAQTGGDGGPAVIPGKLDESLLIDAVLGENGVPKMPPEGEPLKPEEIEILRRWITEGAKAPEEKIPEDPAKHWSYQLPVRPALPSATTAGENPVDAFVAAELARRGLTASPEAPKNLLLRRLYIDLIGIPPTRAELDAFLADNSSDAYEKVVDRLLQSPQYGERWGRHWMDVWRYSDWDGFGAEVRESQPHIWRWRDWIIESLNQDKPYDRMVVEMIAGDEVAPGDADTIRATGYLVRNWYKFNRNVWLDFSVEHTAKAFLATTVNCARCHDHMYDPISQQDYYRFRAFFEAHEIRTDRVPGEADTTKAGLARVYEPHTATPTFLFTRGDEKRPDKDHPLTAGVPAILTKQPLAIEAVSLPPADYYPGSRPYVRQESITQSEAAVATAEKNWLTAVASLATNRQKLRDLASTEKPATTPVAGALVLADDFAAAKPDLWTTGPGQWEYKDGHLVQSDPRDAITRLLSVRSHPADFIAKFRFKTTGGDVYKSVGLSFDAVEDRDFWAVYLSGVNKISIFRRVGGQDVYFNDGARDFPVELGREYELKVAVRGNLLNAYVDGRLQFVYRLPAERILEGRFAVWTFDATAEFLKASVEELPADFALYEKIGDAPVPVTEADLKGAIAQGEQAVTLSDRTLATARAALAWTRARLDADNAQFTTPQPANLKDLALAAGRAEREHNVRLTEQTLLQAEQKLATARAAANAATDPGKKAIDEAQNAVTAAAKTRDEAQAALGQPLEGYTRFGPIYPTTSSGRRSALARWIASRENPLTARVAINHMWLRHFGTPLVPSVFDFGLNGKKPTHPELLDWLAVELMDQGWKTKAIHRLIVTSKTYRQQSTTNGAVAEANRQIDPDNVALWRFNVRRMEAEAVRDSTLAVAGQLDRTMNGPEIDENTGMTVARRSVYFRNSKEKKMTFLDLFDRPNVVECYRRSESIVPQQALAMANSPLSLMQSRLLAKSLSEEGAPMPEAERSTVFITTAFRQILNRPPTDEERAECGRFLEEQSARFANPATLTQFTAGTAIPVAPATDPAQRARENLIHVLLNHNDFLTIR